jgi:hypothetical protein
MAFTSQSGGFQPHRAAPQQRPMMTQDDVQIYNTQYQHIPGNFPTIPQQPQYHTETTASLSQTEPNEN